MEDVKAAIQSGANNKGIIGANLMGKAADMIKKNIETTKVVVPAVIKEVVTKENTWGGNSGGATVPKQNNAQVNITVQPIKPTPTPTVQPTVVAKQITKPVDENESIVEEEMSKLNNESRQKAKKKGGNDEIYEGGEAEVTEILVDPDEDEVVDEKRTRVKYREVVDWRLQMNVFPAFWKGQLRKNDYQIFFSSILSALLLAVGAWLVCRAQNSYIGITLFIPFAHY